MKKTSQNLMKNTFMLYMIQFSNYFFNFIVIPYETRILGPKYFGKIGVATAIMTYFQLFLDFGFMLSATEYVSRNRNDKNKVNSIYTCVTVLKCFFSVISLLIMAIICLCIPEMRKDWQLYFWYLMTAVIYAFLPDYLYRGLEKMESIAYRAVAVKAFAVIMTFVFLKEPGDYLVVPILGCIGNFFAVLWASWDIHHNLNVNFVKITLKELYREFKNSSAFFLSRIISTIYTATNTLIIKAIDKTEVLAGYYTAANKLMTTGQKALSPISDSLYPYMISKKDFKMMKRIFKIFMPPIILGSIVIFIFAPQLCSIVFGKEFRNTGNILRTLMPLAVITLPNYMLGFPALGAIGLAKYANRSIYIGTIFHVLNLCFLWLTGNLNAITLALSTSIADTLVTIYRAVVVYKNRKLYRRE